MRPKMVRIKDVNDNDTTFENYLPNFLYIVEAAIVKTADGKLHGLYLEALCDGLDNALNPYR